MPLILGGWAFSSASEKHQRWLDTVDWAVAHGASDLVATVPHQAFYDWETNEPGYESDFDEFLYAAGMGDVETLRKLLANGAAVDGRDGDGLYALEVAVRENEAEAVAYLITVPSVLAHQGDAALLRAASWARPDLINRLLDAGVDVECTNPSGWTALTHAAYLADIATVERLLLRGSSVNHRDSAGMTPLIHAACRGAGDIVEYLLRHGADAEIADLQGWTAEKWAGENGYPLLAEQIVRWRQHAR